MKNVFIEILNRLITSIALMIIIFLASYCLVTGEFPPKWKNLKAGVIQLQDQLKLIKKFQEQKLNALTKTTQMTNTEDLNTALNPHQQQSPAQDIGSAPTRPSQPVNAISPEVNRQMTELILRYNELRDAHNTLKVQYQVLQNQVLKLETKNHKK